MTISTAIKITIENGYNEDEDTLLDRDFWVAYGKGMGWEEKL